MPAWANAVLRSKLSPPDALVSIWRVTEDVLYRQYETINIFRRGRARHCNLTAPNA